MDAGGQDPCSDLFRTRMIMLQHIKMYLFVLLYSLVSVRSISGSICLVSIVLLNSLSFVRTCTADPGRVNKKTQHKYLPDVVRFGQDIEVQIVVGKNGGWARKIQIGDREYEEKYCLECNVFRVDGMSHCRECNRCILDMDHHCVWFGTCIARNNLKHFHIYLYTLVAVILTNTLFLYRLLTSRTDSGSMAAIVSRWCLFVLLLLYIFFLGLMVLFTAFSIYIAMCSSTSRDFIKSRRNTRPDIRRACIGLSTIRPDTSFEEFSV